MSLRGRRQRSRRPHGERWHRGNLLTFGFVLLAMIFLVRPVTQMMQSTSAEEGTKVRIQEQDPGSPTKRQRREAPVRLTECNVGGWRQ